MGVEDKKMRQNSKKQVVKLTARCRHDAENLRAKREQLCVRIDTAIRSINLSIAALERISAQQSEHFKGLGIRLPDWNVQQEWILEAIAEALAYPKTGPSLPLVDVCHIIENTLASHSTDRRETPKVPVQQLLPLINDS
jgi:hypothetical protein